MVQKKEKFDAEGSINMIACVLNSLVDILHEHRLVDRGLVYDRANEMYRQWDEMRKIIKGKDKTVCGRCGIRKKSKGAYICKKCFEDEKLTQWGRG